MKTWENLFIPAVILVLLITGMLVYNYVLKDNLNPPTETSAETAADGRYVVHYQSADIAAIHVLKSDGTGYTVSSTGIGADGTAAWTYASDGEDVSAYQFSQANLSSFVSIMSSCDTVKTITDAKDTLSEYGLIDPAYTVKYTLASGEVHTLFFGSKSYDGKDVYCTLDDSGIVYTTYLIKATTCDASLIDFLDSAITSVKSNDVASVSFIRPEVILTLVAARQPVPTASGRAPEVGWVLTRAFTMQVSAAFAALV